MTRRIQSKAPAPLGSSTHHSPQISKNQHAPKGSNSPLAPVLTRNSTGIAKTINSAAQEDEDEEPVVLRRKRKRPTKVVSSDSDDGGDYMHVDNLSTMNPPSTMQKQKKRIVHRDKQPQQLEHVSEDEVPPITTKERFPTSLSAETTNLYFEGAKRLAAYRAHLEILKHQARTAENESTQALMQAQIILERTTLGREIAEKDRLEAERQLVEAQASIKISKRLNSEGPKFPDYTHQDTTYEYPQAEEQNDHYERSQCDDEEMVQDPRGMPSMNYNWDDSGVNIWA